MRLRSPRGWAAGALLLLLPAGTASAQLPPEVIADFTPGPWVFFFESGAVQPTSESRVAVKRIGEMAARFPKVGIALCYQEGVGMASFPTMRLQRLSNVGHAVRRAGIRRVTIAESADCGAGPPRSAPLVMAQPAGFD